LGASSRPSVDQCPQTTTLDAVRRFSCANHGANPGGANSAALLAKLHAVIRGAETQTRKRIHDRAQPIEAVEVVAPRMRLVAIKHAQERFGIRALQRRLDLASEREHALRVPLRQQACVHHQQRAFGQGERLPRKPAEQLVAVARIEDRCKRVVAVGAPMARRDDQQVQIVIAEHRRRRVAQRPHFAQHAERVRSPIDEIAGDPEPVVARREADQRQQLAEFGVAALDVADRVMRHRFLSFSQYVAGALGVSRAFRQDSRACAFAR
jgi:hypothetical protein